MWINCKSVYTGSIPVVASIPLTLRFGMTHARDPRRAKPAPREPVAAASTPAPAMGRV